MPPIEATGRERERLEAYVLLGVQVLLLVAVFFLPAGTAWSTPHWLWLISKALWWIGAAILLAGFVNLGRSSTALPTPTPRGELRTSGLYRFVRHPIYTGLIAMAIGSAIPSGNPLSAIAVIALIAWLNLKARWEEARLTTRYPGYAEYAARTPRFLPFWPTSSR